MQAVGARIPVLVLRRSVGDGVAFEAFDVCAIRPSVMRNARAAREEKNESVKVSGLDQV